ncbi:dioxygenase [Clostridium felsineum]|uniref:DODA-type extradiol aromatic ring-opening family dioxygenase n=1 Tax=Clostridium felsineum TaxID=36839 RepID=UPI00214D83B3|nr:class III extradiol ring-cleavage dioxygenase [Clostridium felsineum]MCR3761306.1 dioxygenase [Clostridium felsineum]
MISPMFICHGSPELVLQDNEYTKCLKKVGKEINPKVIVVFTAHFENKITTISNRDDQYTTIHDFYGFEDKLYTINYPAKGSKVIAEKIKDMFDSNNIDSEFDYNRGLDHGTWSILKLMFPKADVPVVQISVNPYLAMDKQYDIGNAIKELSSQDILVVGSGATVHNLAKIKWEKTTPDTWAVEFDDWLINKVEQKDLKSLFYYRKLAPNAEIAVPREEHIVPFFIILGVAGLNKDLKVLSRKYDYGNLSYVCMEF